MMFDTTTRQTSIRIKKPIHRDAVGMAKDVYMEATANAEQRPEITLDRNMVILNGPATNAVNWALKHLPPDINNALHAPETPLGKLRKLLADKNPGRVAFLDYVSQISGIEGITAESSESKPPANPGLFSNTIIVSPGMPMPAIDDTSAADDDTPKKKVRITDIRAHKVMPPVYIELDRQMREAVEAIDTAQTSRTSRPVFLLGLKLDSIRPVLQEAEADFSRREGKYREYPPNPTVTEWLGETLKAMDDRVITDEIAARKANSTLRM